MYHSAQHFLSKQFWALHQLTVGPNYNVDNTNLIEISLEGLMKFLYELKNGQAAKPESIRKKDGLVS